MRCLWFNIFSFFSCFFFVSGGFGGSLCGSQYDDWRFCVCMSVCVFGTELICQVCCCCCWAWAEIIDWALPKKKKKEKPSIRSVISPQCRIWNWWKECAIFLCVCVFFNNSFNLLLWCLVTLTPSMLPIWITLRCLFTKVFSRIWLSRGNEERIRCWWKIGLHPPPLTPDPCLSSTFDQASSVSPSVPH